MVEGLSEFGPTLRRLREAKGIGLRQLAREVHYSPGYVSKMERSLTAPTIEFVKACDRVLAPRPPLIEITFVPAPLAARLQLARPAQLPTVVGDFVGRDDTLRALDHALTANVPVGAVPITVLEGAPGVGKTAIALHWAHANIARYPDGALFANLCGLDPRGEVHPGDVLKDWLQTLGVPAERTPVEIESRSALLRSLLAEKRLMIVLDNASSASQVMPLLPSAAGCAVLITTRRHLPELLAQTGASQITLSRFADDEAVAFLRNVIGDERVTAEPLAAATIVGWCGHFPLVLRVVAQYIAMRPHDTLTDLAGQLTAQTARVGLGMLSTMDDTSSIRAALAWSYAALSQDAQTLFMLLSLHAGAEISVEAMAALSGEPLEAIRGSVDQLVLGHLLENVDAGRYRFHDLLHAYAAERAHKQIADTEKDAAIQRMLSWYLHSACSANHALAPQRGQPVLPTIERGVTPLVFAPAQRADALAWCEQETDNLLGATEQAYDHRHFTVAWLIPVVQFHTFHLRKLWRHWIRGSTIGLVAAREAGDRFGEAWCLHNAGWPMRQLRRSDEALKHFEAAVAIRDEIGDQWGLGWSTFALGATYSDLSRPNEASACLERAIEIFRSIGFGYGIATAQVELGAVYHQIGDPEAAATSLTDGMALYDQLQAHEGRAEALTRKAVIELDRGHAVKALECLDLAQDIQKDQGDRWGEAEVFLIRGQVYRALDDGRAARVAFTHSLELFEDLLDPRVSDARAELATLDIGELPLQVWHGYAADRAPQGR